MDERALGLRISDEMVVNISSCTFVMRKPFLGECSNIPSGRNKGNNSSGNKNRPTYSLSFAANGHSKDTQSYLVAAFKQLQPCPQPFIPPPLDLSFCDSRQQSCV